MVSFFSAQEKWNYTAEEMDQTKVDEKIIRRLKKNVRFVKTGQIFFTDNAIQHIEDDILYMNGNTMMINGLDTLTCDSMVYWSELDSGYAMGNVDYLQSENGRHLMTELFHYKQTEGYRGLSFKTIGYTQIIENNKIITANKISYNDDTQIMKMKIDASITTPTQGISGNEMIIQYMDSLIKEVSVITNAFAYNDLNIKIKDDGPYWEFRDEMSSKEMKVHFKKNNITQLELRSMATTLYHVADDSLLAGNNEASGDSICVDFMDGDISQIQVMGGALGEFKPESNNSQIDTTIFYGAEYFDYHVNDEKTFLSNGAYVEYENTKLSSGKIIVDWKTNILDAIELNKEYPTAQTLGEAPMKGNSMIFDLIAKHGRIIQGRTSFNQSFYHGREVFRDDPNVIHVRKSKYTSCELDHPHFFLGSHKMKMLPRDKVIARPLWLHIYDIPIIGIPLAVFPNKDGNRHSGWLMPSFDSNTTRGTGLSGLGYYWAPNEYLDGTVIFDFFDEDGIYLDVPLNYIYRNGKKWYNFEFNGHFKGSFDQWLVGENDEIMDLINDSNNIKEKITLDWYHSQKFDPTQTFTFNYHYVSDKDAYQNERVIDREDQLTQNLLTSVFYSKIWQASSFSIGYSEERNIGIENKSPDSMDLIDDRYIFYKSKTGPEINLNIWPRKIFGKGDNWYNTLRSSYSLKAKKGMTNFRLIKLDSLTWDDRDTSLITNGFVQQKASLSAPNTFFGWLTLTPNISLLEDWIFSYNQINDFGEEISEQGFKRRLTWISSFTASSKIYGLFPIPIGRLNAIRHVAMPSLTFQHVPNFSDARFGGNSYFQKLESGELYDYFKNAPSPLKETNTTEIQIYGFSLRNKFYPKIRNKVGGYDKPEILTWNSSMQYYPLKNSFNVSKMYSEVRVKDFSGKQLVSIRMNHDFYQLNDEGARIDKLIDIFNGESPRLTSMNIENDMKINLFGTSINSVEEIPTPEPTEIIDEKPFAIDEKKNSSIENKSIWETELYFKYKATWTDLSEKWDYNFSLSMNNSIDLSNNWKFSYFANVDLKNRKLTFHSIKLYRPLHCWEFNFEYYPIWDRYSLRINVRNPDLQDIKITSHSPFY